MKQRTHEEFVELVSHLPFVVLGNYINTNTKVKFKCRVDGHIWDAKPHHIINGTGCPKCGDRRSAESKRRPNIISEDFGNYVEVDISTNKYPQATMLIDKYDLPLLTGRVHLDNKGYGRLRRGNRLVRVHRLIHPSYKEIDHINRCKTDNRRINLRKCSHTENMNNIQHKPGSSGVSGVSWNSWKNKWCAYIRINGKVKHLGTFKFKKDAVQVRRLAEGVKNEK